MNDDKENKSIIINYKRKIYTNEEYDITIIEIKPTKDDINNYINYMKIDEKYIKNPNIIYEKSIYLIHYPSGDKGAVSFGIINRIDKYNIEHYCSTHDGSSGSPILNILNNKIIGVHKENIKKRKVNRGTLLKYPIKEFIDNIDNNNIFSNMNNNMNNNIMNNNDMIENNINNNMISNHMNNNNIMNMNNMMNNNIFNNNMMNNNIINNNMNNNNMIDNNINNNKIFNNNKNVFNNNMNNNNMNYNNMINNNIYSSNNNYINMNPQKSFNDGMNNINNNNNINEKKIQKYPNKIGLENLGHSGYMNASLQCLFNIEILSKKLLNKYLTLNPNIKPLTSAYTTLLFDLKNETSKYINPSMFKSIIGDLNPRK